MWHSGRMAGLWISCHETGVTVAEKSIAFTDRFLVGSRFNVGIAAAMLRQTSDLVDLLDSTESPVDGHILRRRPAGVVLGIAPWNAAVTLATRAVAAPLACGNTVVLKGSELCPKTHEWVADTICKAGLPDGVLNYITNAPDHAEEVVDALIAHPAVRRVNFTGSTRVGREIAMNAASPP